MAFDITLRDNNIINTFDILLSDLYTWIPRIIIIM